MPREAPRTSWPEERMLSVPLPCKRTPPSQAHALWQWRWAGPRITSGRVKLHRRARACRISVGGVLSCPTTCATKVEGIRSTGMAATGSAGQGKA